MKMTEAQVFRKGEFMQWGAWLVIIRSALCAAFIPSLETTGLSRF